MELRQVVCEYLAADSLLSGILPGGVYALAEITRQAAPGAFDENLELRPCALVKLAGVAPEGPYPEAAGAMLAVYLYEAQGYAHIDRALNRLFQLLDGCKLAAGVWTVRHVGDVQDVEDQALRCSLAVSRYRIVHRRS